MTTNINDHLSAQRRAGYLVVSASSAYGRAVYMAITSRDDLLRDLDFLCGKSRRVRRAVTECVAGRVRAAIRRPVGEGYNPAEDGDLMSDLRILLALALLLGEEVAARAGLMALHLAIEEDESLPWWQCGQLDPALVEELGLDPRPVVDCH